MCMTRKRNIVSLLCNTHQLNKPRDWSDLTKVSSFWHVLVCTEEHYGCAPAVKILQQLCSATHYVQNGAYAFHFGELT